MAKEQIVFSALEGLNLPTDTLDMFEALMLLEKENERLLKEEAHGHCEVTLLDKKQTLLFSLAVSLPLTEPIEDLIIGELAAHEAPVTKKAKKKKKKPRDLTIKNVEKKQVKTAPKEKVAPAIKKKPSDDATLEPMDKAPKSLSPLIKKVGMVGILLLLGLGGGFGIKTLMSNTQATSEVTVQDMFETELKTLTPDSLGEKYPTRLEEIAAYYVKQQSFDQLEQFNRLYPTENGTFDLAFYQQEWQTVIQTPVDHLTDERKIMLAHAYIQLGQLEEATLLNKSLKSQQLTLEIDKKRLEQLVTLLQQKKLEEATELSKELTTTECQEASQVYLDDASLIIQMMSLYEKKKDKENEALWERKLMKIGTVITHDY